MPRRRWYVDADTLGLAHILAQVRPDVTYCGDSGERRKFPDLPACEIQDTETDDAVWIPTVTRAGLAIITRDIHIWRRIHEKDVVLSCAAQVFCITSPGQLDNWGLLEVVATQWREMEKRAGNPGPYMYSVTRTRLSSIDLTNRRRPGSGFG